MKVNLGNVKNALTIPLLFFTWHLISALSPIWAWVRENSIRTENWLLAPESKRKKTVELFDVETNQSEKIQLIIDDMQDPSIYSLKKKWLPFIFQNAIYVKINLYFKVYSHYMVASLKHPFLNNKIIE